MLDEFGQLTGVEPLTLATRTSLNLHVIVFNCSGGISSSWFGVRARLLQSLFALQFIFEFRAKRFDPPAMLMRGIARRSAVTWRRFFNPRLPSAARAFLPRLCARSSSSLHRRADNGRRSCRP